MGRAPCCDKNNVKRGPWSPEEDAKLKSFIDKYGTGGNWIALPQKAGLKRCGKSCRLRWLNYLRPNIKHGEFTDDEDRIICSLYANIGSRWSIIAAQLPGRTDNDIKNYWNTKLKKKLLAMLPSFQKKASFYPSLPLQSPPLYSNSSPFYSYTNPNFMNLNNNINSFLNTTNTLSQDHLNMPNLSLPQQDSINLLTTNNNNISNNENNSFYLGFQENNNDQNMFNHYPTSNVKEAMLMFGNHEGSTTGSTSENGSCLSQISYENFTNKDHHHHHHQIKQEDKFFLQGFGDQSQSFIMSYIDEKPNNLKDYESLLQSELEEVKQLIIGNENDDEYKTTHDHDHNKEIFYHY